MFFDFKSNTKSFRWKKHKSRDGIGIGIEMDSDDEHS